MWQEKDLRTIQENSRAIICRGKVLYIVVCGAVVNKGTVNMVNPEGSSSDGAINLHEGELAFISS